MTKNGIGKSTLVRILLKNPEQADKGRVKHGFGFKPAYFDQNASLLIEYKSPWVILTGGGSDTIEITQAQACRPLPAQIFLMKLNDPEGCNTFRW